MNGRIWIFLLLLLASPLSAKGPNVVVSIKPIHSLVASVMKGVGEPILLLSPGHCPHHFSLTPGEAEFIHKSDLFVWIGPRMEMVLEKPVKILTLKSQVLTIMDLPGLTLYNFAGGQKDPHLWLDPENAKVIVKAAAEALSTLDPDHSGIYTENAAKLLLELDQLKETLAKDLAPLKDKSYFVYHDAFQYYEKTFGLNRSTPALKDTEHTVRNSQRQLLEKLTKDQNVTCIFGETGHGEKMIESLAEQLHLRMGYLDPIGTHESTYMGMMEGIASSLNDCLLKDKTQ